MPPEDVFARGMVRWQAEQQTPWSQLKYRLVAANLARHIPSEPQQILDAGGGNGVEALALARAGHQIALVDSSEAMLADARQSFADAGLNKHCAIYQRDLAGLGELFAPQSFDGVLCHNVIQYVDDVERLLATLATLLKPGGWLSLVSINRFSVPYQTAFLHQDLVRASQSLDDHTQLATIFGLPMRMYSAEEVAALLARQGFGQLHHYGVRCICDYWGTTEQKMQPEIMAQIEQLENRLSDAYPYKLLARYFHLIAWKL